VLGLVWSLAHPVVLMLVYLLVFSVMLKIQTADYEHYWLFLLCGLPVWVFFATSLQSPPRACSRTRI
jgi:ABC-type polysaccharide/polyol phosphate export permease